MNTVEQRPNCLWPHQSFDVFISYCHADLCEAKKVVEGLKVEGLTVWFDESSYTAAAENFGHWVESALDHSQSLLCLMSPSASLSNWVAGEVHAAAMQRKLVFARLKSGEINENFHNVILEDLRFTRPGARYPFEIDISDWNSNRDHQGWRRVISEIRTVISELRAD